MRRRPVEKDLGHVLRVDQGLGVAVLLADAARGVMLHHETPDNAGTFSEACQLVDREFGLPILPYRGIDVLKIVRHLPAVVMSDPYKPDALAKGMGIRQALCQDQMRFERSQEFRRQQRDRLSVGPLHRDVEVALDGRFLDFLPVPQKFTACGLTKKAEEVVFGQCVNVHLVVPEQLGGHVVPHAVRPVVGRVLRGNPAQTGLFGMGEVLLQRV